MRVLASWHLGNYKRYENGQMGKILLLFAQLFSKSVADALMFCKNILKIEEFKNVDATAKFILLINNVFDILNSRNINNTSFKAPLSLINRDNIFAYLVEAKNYLLNLKTLDNVRLIDSGRKVGFIGLCCCIESTIILFQNLVETEKTIEFLPMYKLSQDHLELFFVI